MDNEITIVEMKHSSFVKEFADELNEVTDDLTSGKVNGVFVVYRYANGEWDWNAIKQANYSGYELYGMIEKAVDDFRARYFGGEA